MTTTTTTTGRRRAATSHGHGEEEEEKEGGCGGGDGPVGDGGDRTTDTDTDTHTEDTTTTTTTTGNDDGPTPPTITTVMVRPDARRSMVRGVLRAKLAGMRHLVLQKLISPEYLDALMVNSIIPLFDPQRVVYNGFSGDADAEAEAGAGAGAGVNASASGGGTGGAGGGGREWRISCYLEVMPGGIPTASPNLRLRSDCLPLLDRCDDLFAFWYGQQHARNDGGRKRGDGGTGHGGERVMGGVRRLMTFITRYTPNPGEDALLKHIDGAGRVDGSVVVALPTVPECDSFVGHGGGLTFWDGGRGRGGRGRRGRGMEQKYDTRSGDVAFIDRAVWHQANPITGGVRWALVIFYGV